MKERLITLAMAAGALALFWMLMFPKPSVPTAPHPLTTGDDGEGYAVMAKWFVASGVPTVEMHERFDHLPDRHISREQTGNLLIMTLPFDVALHAQEYQALDEWVRAGNTALILAALDDTPLWTATADDFAPQLQKLTGIEFFAKSESDQNSGKRSNKQPRPVTIPPTEVIALKPSGRIALLSGITQLAARTPLPSVQWQIRDMDAAPVLELARRSGSEDPVLWLKPIGNGVLVLSAYASLFSNSVIGKSDNARLLSNLVAWSLRPGGRVIIDDAHQGAIEEYDAARFFSDPRLHRTLLWLVVLWLAWVLAAQPMRAAAPNADSLDEAVMLRAEAGFFASVLRPTASAQWLLDEFFERLRRRHGLLHSTSPPWEWLASHAGVASDTLGELRILYAHTRAGHRVSLVRLQAIISQISGQTS